MGIILSVVIKIISLIQFDLLRNKKQVQSLKCITWYFNRIVYLSYNKIFNIIGNTCNVCAAEFN